ncbi:hypothetical protein AGLY_002970 [Aphis glycines]|uniref:Uncharacterized protein n=1 Tax=Aphis glycines TaxID=307491 RepID=A0A6G0U357_APHGL|nr:hypothetical protein AGLY_002970 [Aphis glycines]
MYYRVHTRYQIPNQIQLHILYNKAFFMKSCVLDMIQRYMGNYGLFQSHKMSFNAWYKLLMVLLDEYDYRTFFQSPTATLKFLRYMLKSLTFASNFVVKKSSNCLCLRKLETLLKEKFVGRLNLKFLRNHVTITISNLSSNDSKSVSHLKISPVFRLAFSLHDLLFKIFRLF